MEKGLPIYKNPDSQQEYTCIGWACDIRTGWEWYAFEVVEKTSDDTIYFGLVHGYETEFGDFSLQELKQNKIKFHTSLADLNGIQPPIGWERVDKKVKATKKVEEKKAKATKKIKSGIYETIYGNACEYEAGSKTAYDLDMAEQIPLEAVDFSKYIRDFD